MSFSPCFGYHSWRKKSSSVRLYPIGNKDPPFNVLLIELTLFTSFSVSDILLFFSSVSIANHEWIFNFTVYSQLHCGSHTHVTSAPYRLAAARNASTSPRFPHPHLFIYSSHHCDVYRLRNIRIPCSGKLDQYYDADNGPYLLLFQLYY